MKAFILEPEVAGQLGPKTEMDTSTHPPRVDKLHLVFDGWLGDDLLEYFPCYVVTSKLKEALEREALTGIRFDSVEIERSESFVDTYGDRPLPGFHWMKIAGEAETADFFLEDNMLVVSERGLSVLQKCTIDNCDIEER